MSIRLKRFLSAAIVGSLFFGFAMTPFITYAQTPPTSPTTCIYTSGGIGGLIGTALCLLKSVVPLLVTAAVVVFIYGLVIYIRNADNSEKRKEGNQFIMYGLIALFVMVSTWALVGIMTATFGITSTTLPTFQLVQ